MRRFLLPLLLAACGGADRTVLPAPGDYAEPASWLCLPGGQGRAGGQDPCATYDLGVDVVDAEGRVTHEAFAPGGDPPADCFYVYPTASDDRTSS